MAILREIQELSKRIKFIVVIEREEENGKDFIKKCEGLRTDLNNVVGMDVIAGKGKWIPLTKDSYAFSVDLPGAKREEIKETIRALAKRQGIKLGKEALK